MRFWGSFVSLLIRVEPLVGLVTVGALISNTAFVVAALLLFRLGRIVLRNEVNGEAIALRAALLFCCNPASIFFSVAYTESLFAMFAFGGMYVLAKNSSFNNRLLGSLLFGLATFTRSNGAILCVYSLYVAYLDYQTAEPNKKVVNALIQLAVVGLIHGSFLVAFLGYGYYLFCYNTAPELIRPWCR